jgi:M6 family metalloprotease-like protein
MKFTVTLLLVLFLAHEVFAAPSWGRQFFFSQPDGSKVPVLVWGDEYFQHVESPQGRVLVRNNSGWIVHARMSPDSSAYLPTDTVYVPQPLGAPSFSVPLEKPGFKSEAVAMRRNPLVKRSVRDSVIAKAKQRLGVDKLKWQGKVRSGYQPAPASSSSGTQPPPGFLPAPPEPDSRLFRSGTIRALTIFVDFSDQPATMTKADLDSLYNQVGYSKYGNNGSVHDYYRDVSLGKIDLKWDFVGYVRAPKPKWYYDNPTMTTPYEHTWEFINDVVGLADAQYDFSTLTKNPYNNNSVLSLTIMYAGDPAGGWTMGLWPHAGYLGVTLDNQWIQGYSCVNIGNMALEIGTIAHEAGHSIGNYADFYDMDGGGAGTGTYDLMGTGGGGNPPLLGPHNLMQSGWANVVDVSYLDRDSTFSIQENTNTVLKFVNPTADEQYYIEMRHNTPRPTPAEGLILWHADGTYGVNNNREQMTPTEHYWMSVEQADNQFHMERGQNWGDTNDAFRGGYKNSFTLNSLPSSRWWNGSDSKLSITQISNVGPTMSLRIGARPGTYQSATVVNPVVNGLQYKAMDGSFTQLSEMSNATSYLTGNTTNLNISVSGKTDNFALQFTGYIQIPATGNYTFYLKSDDGSRFTLDGQSLITNDGLHDDQTELNGAVGLQSGLHPIVVDYFEGGGGESLTLSWQSDKGLAKQVIPATAFFRAGAVTTSSSSSGSSSSSVSGTCDTIAENASLNLSCPSGQVVVSVIYANYGKTNGQCGSYTVGTCSATSTRSIVESRCLNKANCSIQADNATFGEPCQGILKNLVLHYKCESLPVGLAQKTFPLDWNTYQGWVEVFSIFGQLRTVAPWQGESGARELARSLPSGVYLVRGLGSRSDALRLTVP